MEDPNKKLDTSESISSSEETESKSDHAKERIFEVETDTWRNVTLYEKKEKYEPSGRYGHTAVEVTNGGFSAMYVLGGGDATGKFCRELLEFDFESLSFLPPSEQKLFEHGRHFHSTVIYKNVLYVFGGKSNGYYNDVHSLDTNNAKWVKLEVKGTPPSPRYGHTACLWNNKMVVFGGYDNDGFTSNDVFLFDLTEHTWERIAVPEPLPAPRFSHTCVVFHNKMYLFGGREADNNVWAFDLLRKKWREINVKGPKPSPRYGHSWNWVGGDLAPTLIAFGGTNGKEAYNQLWSFNIAKKRWNCLANDKKLNNAPAPRYFHSSLVQQGFLLVFGGRSTTDLAFNDFIKIPVRINFLPMLPDEIMLRVFGKLNIVDLSRCNSVCKQWKLLSDDGALWKQLVTDITNADVPGDEKNKAARYKKILRKIIHQNKDSDQSSWKLGWNNGNNLAHNALKFKFVIVGCGAVGKTCFLIRYTSRTFPVEYIPTVFDNYTAQKVHNGIPVAFSLWDVSGGGEDYDRLRPLSYPYTDVFIMMFSLISQASYARMSEKWWPEITHHAPQALKILVGSKADLRDDPDTIEKLKEKGLKPVTDAQAEELRIQVGAKEYIPVSSLTGYNVDQAIDAALNAAISHILIDDPNATEHKKRCLMM